MNDKNFNRILELSGLPVEKPLNEVFVNPPEAETDEDILRISIIAELDAVSLYKQFAKKAKDEGIKKVLEDIAGEEEIHIGELEKLLKDINPELVGKLKKGEREVKKTLKNSEPKEEVTEEPEAETEETEEAPEETEKD